MTPTLDIFLFGSKMPLSTQFMCRNKKKRQLSLSLACEVGTKPTTDITSGSLPCTHIIIKDRRLSNIINDFKKFYMRLSLYSRVVRIHDAFCRLACVACKNAEITEFFFCHFRRLRAQISRRTRAVKKRYASRRKSAYCTR